MAFTGQPSAGHVHVRDLRLPKPKTSDFEIGKSTSALPHVTSSVSWPPFLWKMTWLVIADPSSNSRISHIEHTITEWIGKAGSTVVVLIWTFLRMRSTTARRLNGGA